MFEIEEALAMFHYIAVSSSLREDLAGVVWLDQKRVWEGRKEVCSERGYYRGSSFLLEEIRYFLDHVI